MVQYRRLRAGGGYYFFTLVLQNRKSQLLTKYNYLLRESWQFVQARYPFKTIAFVILPDHLHAVWELPEKDDDYPKRLRLIKTLFTQKLTLIRKDFQKNKRGEYNIWQKRYWEHMIRSEKDYENHVNYIHYNPVKHGYVKRIRDWPHSSFLSYVKKGVYPINWSDSELATDLKYNAE